MKRNKILTGFIGLCIIASIQAKDSYYYYNNSRIALHLSDDSVSVYTKIGHSIKEISKNSYDTTVTSIEYLIEGENGTYVEMSNRFYVQLYDSINDIPLLNQIAHETNAAVVGKVPYMPDWYELLAYNSYPNNTLELSNYFYETGLFRNIDPGFILHFTSSTSACVSDSHFSYQWGMNAIKACDAWDITTGSPNIKIAIIDRGIDRNHDEFTLNHFVNKYDCHSRDTTGYQIYTDHGNWVCGVISSDHNHAQIAGVAPDCKIIPISYSLQDTTIVAEDLATGFAWAASHGADVINCSWGDHNTFTYLHRPILESAIHDALTFGRNGKGCVIVFSAGNQNSQQLDYPGRVFPEILTVGAMKSDSTKREDSSWGYDLDVMAPGDNIYTTDIWNEYIYASQTSLATPHVSGIAGLMLSVNPDLTRQEVTDIIESTARKVQPSGVNYNYYDYSTTTGRPNGKWDLEMGYGLVNAYAAVAKARDTQIRGPKEICDGDTAKYYLIHPLQQGETVAWTTYSGMDLSPVFSIVGSSTQDTVYVRCHDIYMRSIDFPIDPIDPRKYLSATITNTTTGTSDTYIKILSQAHSEVPTISASNTSTLWFSQTPRTFTVTNCNDVPDSLLQWTVIRKGTTPPPPLHPTIHTYNYYGRTLTYSPPSPPSISRPDTLTIYATNLAGVCGAVNSNSMRFVVAPRKILLNGNVDGQQLNITIMEDSEDSQRLMAQLDEDSNYTLELWHSIYGAMRVQTVYNANEQMSISGLPQGVYVLSLKENGIIIAQTKVQIE